MQQTFICDPKRVSERIRQRDTRRGDCGHWQRHEGRQQEFASGARPRIKPASSGTPAAV
jgi:hypothetical protein